MGLSRQVVDLVGPDSADDFDQADGIAQIAIVQMKTIIVFQMGDALSVVDGRPSDDAVYFISLFQQQFAQIRAILSGNSGN